MKKQSVLKKLKTEAEKLWKEVCRLRDRYKCAWCGLEKHEGNGVILQVDHCFSRSNSELFLDIKNGTTLCISCHFKKSKKIEGFDRRVDHLVIKREGAEWFTDAEQIYMSLKPFVWDVIKLEQKIIELKERRAELLMNRD